MAWHEKVIIIYNTSKSYPKVFLESEIYINDKEIDFTFYKGANYKVFFQKFKCN